MIKSVLIANRGEIACRIIRTARALGVRTVAVYSDADAKALHVRSADDAIHVGPSSARASYLDGERIIAAAKASGAEAIHPGYGFLSENAEFARAVQAAGLVWVGPDPASIGAMGLKDQAKRLMADAGVPVTPGYSGERQDLDFLAERADDIGYPVLIKAVAGGGGKGMRRVDSAADFADALASCTREAVAAFGNAHVLIEKYIEHPRHLEVQVFGDRHGNVVHLFERDCSPQRRHQKVIEEAPAPGMDAATRAALCAAAVRAAKAVDYVNAGTVEFIADASEGLRADRIWFMEMNTRLQVEHPVTEAITGVDLVEWQLRVASGEPLPRTQDGLAIHGWAMEARLYAEDPAKGFLPSVGRLDHLVLPESARVDTGVEEGDEVSPYYDPMIAKLVVHAPTRVQAAAELADACGSVKCAPVRSNAWFLARLLSDSAFRAGDVSTGFIADRFDAFAEPPQPSGGLLQVMADAMISNSLHVGGHRTQQHAMLEDLRGFRVNAKPSRSVRLRVDGATREVELSLTPSQLRDRGWERPSIFLDDFGDGVAFEDGAAFRLAADRHDPPSGGAAASDGAVLSPMPGRIVAVAVAEGQQVTKGQRLVTVEAMKMEHALTAPFDGIVAELPAREGAQVEEGMRLVRIAAEDGVGEAQ